MDFSVEGASRVLFREDILQERRCYSGTDAAFAQYVLQVSLNTYKKCISNDISPLRLKRQTFTTLIKNCRLNPERYGVDVGAGSITTRFGGYSKAEFGFLAGSYVKYRRSLLTGRNFNRSFLEVRWNDTAACLSFSETMNYRSDRGVTQKVAYSGDVYIHQDRRLFGMLALENGEIRYELAHLPNRPVGRQPRNLFKIRGLQLAHAFPRGSYAPAVSPILLEELSSTAPIPLGKTITPEDSDHQRLCAEFDHMEESAIIVTSLIATRTP